MSSFVSVGGADTRVKVFPVGTSRPLTFQGAGVSVVDDPGNDTIDIIITGSGVGEANIGANVGSGVGIYRDKTLLTLNFKSLIAGNNITITNNTNDITIAGSASTGEANTYSSASVNGGIGITLTKSGVDLPFKGIKAGSTAISVTDDVVNKNVVIDSNAATTSSLGTVQLASSSADTTAGHVVQANDTRLADARTPLSHKSSHVTGGSDAFVKSDILSSVSRYIETITDPTSDTGRIWINSSNLKFWDNQGSPVLQTAERLSNKAIASGYCDLDASTLVPLSRLSGITSTQIASNAAIPYSKLSLGTSIVNSDIATNAAIAYSKLSLTGSLVNGDISSSAAIAYTKIGTNLRLSETGLSALRTFTFPDSDGLVVIGTDTRLTDSRTPLAHKSTHTLGGSDAFAKTDTIAGSSRYIEVVTGTEPTSDVARQWIKGANFKYWDNSGTPILQTVEILANKGIASGYCDLDSSTLVPLSRISGLTNAQISASAAIAYSKLALSGSIVNTDVAIGAAIAYAKLSLNNSITNSDIASSAAIDYTKLGLTNSIVNADIAAAAAIAYTKLALSGSIINTDISNSAAIAYGKLSLGSSIVNSDISVSAAISYSKLALTGSIVDADIASGAAISKSKLGALSIGDADIVSHTTTKITTSLKSLLNANIVYNDQANTFGSFAQTIPSTFLKLSNSGFASTFSVGTLSGDRTLTFPSVTTSIIGNDTTDTLTNKTISGSSNTITNIADTSLSSNIATLTGTQTLTNKTLTNPNISTIINTGTINIPTSSDTLLGRVTTDTLQNKSMSGSVNTFTSIPKTAIPSTTVYTDQVNTYSNFEQVVPSTYLKLLDSTFKTSLSVGSLTGDTTITIPSITDTLLGRTTTDTITNKTVSVSSNILTDATNAAGDILKSDGSKYIRLPRGSANQVLSVNPAGTDIVWATGTGGGGGGSTDVAGTAVKSGDASTTTFTIAHGFGSTPSSVVILGSSSDAESEFSYSVDSTNITVTFPFPPPTGTNNLSFYYRVM